MSTESELRAALGDQTSKVEVHQNPHTGKWEVVTTFGVGSSFGHANVEVFATEAEARKAAEGE